MKIEVPDDIAKLSDIDEREALELLAIAIYKAKGIHGALAGRILGISQSEFHDLLAKRNQTVNYDVQDFLDDMKNNDL